MASWLTVGKWGTLSMQMAFWGVCCYRCSVGGSVAANLLAFVAQAVLYFTLSRQPLGANGASCPAQTSTQSANALVERAIINNLGREVIA